MSWLSIGGSRGRCRRPHPPPPNGIKFFHFRIRFHQKVPASEVGAPQRLGALPTGNPGSATAIPMAYSLFIFNGRSEVQSVGQIIDSEPNQILPGNITRPFSKLRKLANWQLADCNSHINCDHQFPKTDFSWGFGHHSFLYKAQNNCANKQLRMKKHFFKIWYVTDIPVILLLIP